MPDLNKKRFFEEEELKDREIRQREQIREKIARLERELKQSLEKNVILVKENEALKKALSGTERVEARVISGEGFVEPRVDCGATPAVAPVIAEANLQELNPREGEGFGQVQPNVPHHLPILANLFNAAPQNIDPEAEQFNQEDQ